MTSPARPDGRTVSGNGKWFLLALCLAAIAVFGLLWPSIQEWRERTNDSTLSVVDLKIFPLTADAKKECTKADTAALQRATTAVTGTFIGVDGTTATFDADHWYRGGPADRVAITSSSTAKLTEGLKAAGLDGGRVLIASRSGEVLMCGESGPYSDELGALYVTTYGQAAAS